MTKAGGRVPGGLAEAPSMPDREEESIIDGLLHAPFGRCARAWPDRTALWQEGNSMTYGELLHRVGALSQTLVAEHGVGPDVKVALLFEPLLVAKLEGHVLMLTPKGNIFEGLEVELGNDIIVELEPIFRLILFFGIDQAVVVT